jgi:hypothetical protein
MNALRYFNPKSFTRRVVTITNQTILNKAEGRFAPCVDYPLRHPPIFFLGAPRSGSTLAFQVLTDALDVGYLSNGHCRWCGAPGLYEHFAHPTANRPQSDYESNHGDTKGIHAPSECGEWWYRFFRQDPPYVALKEVAHQKMLAFRRSVASLTNAFDRPIVFKNLYASLRIQAIAHYLPESLFIVIHRNEVDNGHSLLEARYKSFGSYAPWFSVKPPQIDTLCRLPPHEQVIEQIRHIHAVIDNDLTKINVSSNRRHDLVFEEFCDAPNDKVYSVKAFLESNGCHVKLHDVSLPDAFSRRSEIRIEQQLYDAMSAYAQQTQPSNYAG